MLISEQFPCTLRIEAWKTEAAIAASLETNPRVISQTELNNLRMSIREFGFVVPAIVNVRTNHLIGGHQRVLAAMQEGVPEIPVALIDLEADREMVLNLALNKIEGNWDFEKLSEVISTLSESEEIALSGFSEADIVSIFSQQDENPWEETFEEFLERQGDTKTSALVAFRSPDVVFTVQRSAFEAFVHKIYKRVGVNDTLAGNYFFDKIGLGETN